MKKNVLIIALLIINIASAQFKLDFESILSQNVGANNDKMISYTDRNTVTDGINTSEGVIKVTEFSGALYWGSTIINEFQNTISLYDGRYFSIDFLSSKEKGMITLKLKNGVEKDFIYSGKPNIWRRAVFNFSGTPKSTTSDKIEIFFDVRDHNNPKKFSNKNTTEEVFWFDNVTQSKRRIRPKK